MLHHSNQAFLREFITAGNVQQCQVWKKHKHGGRHIGDICAHSHPQLPEVSAAGAHMDEDIIWEGGKGIMPHINAPDFLLG